MSAVSAARLPLCFGVHNHQPVGNFDHVVEEAVALAYRPFLERLAARPEIRLTTHWTGSLLGWLRERAPDVFDRLGEAVARGQVEILTGGFYEPILAVLPDHDKIGQIERLTAFIKSSFGVRPRGMWLAERVWEPHLPRVLREAGVEYVLLDDRHFALAGFDPDALGGWYVTEDQGATLGVFPISQRLRYLIPFAEVEATVEHLERHRGRVAALTVVDDGEKFGVWPGTHDHVYRSGWLDRFFDRLLALDWLALSTFADVVDGVAATGRAYLPAASYREMGEWALPHAAALALEAARHEVATLPRGQEVGELLRGGFWRAFLVKYPEVADTYWKMLRLSHAVERASAGRRDDPALAAAREALWRGQANDAYWHGVFGGCYLPHLRRAIKQALLEAERRLGEAAGGPAPGWVRIDGNGDGREEVYVRTPELAVTVNPGLGGSVTELAHLVRGIDVADVLARRPEIYHARVAAAEAGGGVRTIHEARAAKEDGLAALLAYDHLRRASLLDALAGADGALDPVAPWAAARAVLGDARMTATVAATGEAVEIAMTLADGPALPLAVDKRVTVRGASLAARYRLLRTADVGRARWAVQWNLALTAGDAPGRYLDLPGRPSLASAGRRDDIDGVALVDEWIGLEARLAWTPGAEFAWAPVFTVSVSESGFERIYQGTSFLIAWPLADVSSGAWDLATSLTLAPR